MLGGHAGELRYEAAPGGNLVMGDQNGGGNADFAIFVLAISFEAVGLLL